MQGPRITLKQLECLLAVDKALHFRRAAELCGMTQPSLSQQIQGLEDALGLRLMERSRSGVSMTPLGREVVSRARRVAEHVQDIIDLTAGAQKGLLGTIRLGTTPSLGPYILPYVVAALHKQHPELNLYIRENAPLELDEELEKGIHDVILTQLPETSAQFTAMSLFQEPLFLTLANDHPLAKAEAVSVNDLKDLPILSLSPRYRLHDQIVSLCEHYGARLLRDYEGTSLDALRQMVGMGMGATFLPGLYVQSEIKARSEVVVKPLRGRNIYRSIGLVTRKTSGRSETYAEMATILQDVAKRRLAMMQPEDE
ncbi:MAG: hydrogen peroxide-inducible genes activator [Pseudomonadota bacterium]